MRFREALAVFDQFATATGLSGILADVAVLAQSLGQHAAATRLLGAAEALNEVLGDQFWLPWRTLYEQTTATLGTALAPAAFTAAWGAGRALTREQAIAEALTVVGQPANGASD